MGRIHHWGHVLNFIMCLWANPVFRLNLQQLICVVLCCYYRHIHKYLKGVSVPLLSVMYRYMISKLRVGHMSFAGSTSDLFHYNFIGEPIPAFACASGQS